MDKGRLSLCGVLLLVAAAAAPMPRPGAAQEQSENAARLPAAATAEVDFVRDVQPIFVKYCLKCHGADKQQAGYRLDLRGDALRGGDSGPAFEIGKSGESLLIKYVAGLDPDIVMPPEGDKLSKQEISLLRGWIDQGAKWPDDASGAKGDPVHWAFRPIARPAPPAVKQEEWVRNAIDRFVLARLQSRRVAPSGEADRPTLIRRLSLDLLGLPPTPAEVDAFDQDASPDAYEQLVDRLLSSPHFGERWGRHWLDLARYADSDGYEKDSPRPHAWRYRNWVIDALNADKPFDEFTVEQLAGDLLPDATLEQKVATGFHRNTLTNKEGGVDQEEFRVAAVVDRVNTTSTVWLGLTLGCAQCHSHKYDPLAMHEYYGMFAFFNQGQEIDISAPLPHEAEVYARQKQLYDAAHAPYLAAVAAFEKDQLPAREAAWEQSLDRSKLDSWKVLEPVSVTASGNTKFTRQSDGSWLASGENPGTQTCTIELKPALKGITAFRLEAFPDASLPAQGPGRVAHGNFVLSEFKLSAANTGGELKPIELGTASADFSQDQWPVAAAIDGNPKTGWAVAPQFGKRHVAVFETKSDLDCDDETTLTIVLDQQYGMQHTLGRFRLSATTMPRPVKLDGMPDEIANTIAKSAEQRTSAERSKVLAYYATIDPEMIRLKAAEAEHARQAPAAPATRAQALVEVSPPRKTHIHVRGDFLRKGEEVQPHTPAVLHPFRAASARGASRLDLARWLVDPANPLTARVAMNRVWKNLFGQPLVTTVDDFGTRGERPSHPDLLDWLASEFMAPTSQIRNPATLPGPSLLRGGASGPWSLKRMIRLIVCSATYRQSSQARPELIERDPKNVLLARQNRFRLEAEIVRDVALAASGLMTPTVGGPSVHPRQPAGISELTYAGSARWVESTGPDRYRRGLYTWFQRTSPYPMLMTFDAPDSNVTCTRRDRSNTPLQALTMLNDPVFHECAQALGRRIVRERPGDSSARLEYSFELCLGRKPTAGELSRLNELYVDLRALAESDRAAAAKLVGLPELAADDLVDTAAAVALARVLINLDEFVTRE